MEFLNECMKPLIIEGTTDTPYVCFDKENNIFEISGISLPANVLEFYKIVFDWIDEYLSDPNKETHLKFRFEYLNSASTKIVLNIIQKFEVLINKGYDVCVTWYYHRGDYEMKEMGEDFADSTTVPVLLSVI